MAANWKHYMNAKFAGCKLICHAWDKHRLRDVTVWLIPHVWDAVGVFDTVDTWISPLSAEFFSVNVERLVHDYQKGVPFPKTQPISKTTEETINTQPRKRLELKSQTVTSSRPRATLNARKPRAVLRA